MIAGGGTGGNVTTHRTVVYLIFLMIVLSGRDWCCGNVES